jgi:hypothetical protein
MFLFPLKASRNVEILKKYILGSHPHGPVPPLHTMSNQGDCHSLTVHSEKAVQDRPVQGCLNRIFAIIMGNQ